jgi:predicted small integral membrane protein
MQWMSWTRPSAIFFGLILAGLGAMLVWELVSPTVERRGFLPMPTTRGDRFFVSLLTAAFIHMAWIGLSTVSPWGATAISAVVALIIGRWG